MGCSSAGQSRSGLFMGAGLFSLAGAGAYACLSPGQVIGEADSEPEVPHFGPHFISDAAEKASPAVVNITYSASKLAGFLEAKFGGSGVIIDADGTILTNAHVVSAGKQGAKAKPSGDLTVSLQDGRQFTGRVMCSDSKSDLAIVKIDCKEKLPMASLGDSRKIRIGQWVVALGSPLHLQNSVTAGIISCVERKSAELGLLGSRTDYIQTDAAINQGNSGGPLVNLKGEVIGINTFKALAADGVSFSIPIETAKFVIHQYKTYGRVVRPYIGIKMLELTDQLISQLKERDRAFPSISSGVLVPQVTPGGPAEAAGLNPGDVIVKFDGKAVQKGEEVIDLLGHEVGKKHEVVVARAHGRKTVLYVFTEEAVS